MATNVPTTDITKLMDEPDQFNNALEQRLAEVISIHRYLNLPVATWQSDEEGKNGKVIWVQPADLKNEL
ncbi:MAG: hypothetical protein KDA65_10160 [Planctomycetaceae bacterium]|nr:hypothetical protein [Paracoccaceae bacterium]MCA9040699.1 hypothetical protein [Planctomycetaceae bacterium]